VSVILTKILKENVYRKKGLTLRDIKELRDEIDNLDKQLVELLEKRLDVVTEVVKYKIDNNKPIFDASREEEVLAKNLQRVQNNEYEAVIEQILIALMDYSKAYQHNFVNDNNTKTE
jgi:monofunctional chorismate mutase